MCGSTHTESHTVVLSQQIRGTITNRKCIHPLMTEMTSCKPLPTLWPVCNVIFHCHCFSHQSTMHCGCFPSSRFSRVVEIQKVCRKERAQKINHPDISPLQISLWDSPELSWTWAHIKVWHWNWAKHSTDEGNEIMCYFEQRVSRFFSLNGVRQLNSLISFN